MIRDDAVDLIMGRLGNRVSAALQQTIINEMVFVQETILEGFVELPWFLVSEETNTNTVANEHRIQLPPGFLLEWEDGALYLNNTDGKQTRMFREDWDVIKSQASLDGTGKPTYYDIAGNYLLLRKTPDAVYELKLRYYKAAASLAGAYGDETNVENLWLQHAPDWFMGEVGVIIASEHLQSEKMAGRFEQQALKGQARILAKNIALQESNKQRQVGD